MYEASMTITKQDLHEHEKAEKAGMAEVFLKHAVVAIGSVVIAVFGAGWAAYAQVDNRVQEKGNALVQPIEARLKIVEGEQAAVKNDVHEVQADIRALYKAVMTGNPQPRLESDAGKQE